MEVHYTYEDVENMIILASQLYNVSSATLLRVAKCENTNLVPGLARRGRSGPIGIYQWMPGAAAWRTTPYYQQHRTEIHDLYEDDPVMALYQDVFMAAWAFAHGKANQWECY